MYLNSNLFSCIQVFSSDFLNTSSETHIFGCLLVWYVWVSFLLLYLLWIWCRYLLTKPHRPLLSCMAGSLFHSWPREISKNLSSSQFYLSPHFLKMGLFLWLTYCVIVSKILGFICEAFNFDSGKCDVNIHAWCGEDICLK